MTATMCASASAAAAPPNTRCMTIAPSIPKAPVIDWNREASRTAATIAAIACTPVTTAMLDHTVAGSPVPTMTHRATGASCATDPAVPAKTEGVRV